MKTYAHLSLVFIMESLFSVASVRVEAEETFNDLRQTTVGLGYDVIKENECYIVIVTEEYNVMVNSDELICTTEYLTL
jgi:hypothetical protein